MKKINIICHIESSSGIFSFLLTDDYFLLLGDFGCITWEGYDFATDVTINTEICQWTWFKKVHDGPITHSVRSRQNGSWIATIGGKIFAIWKEDVHAPVLWKKSDVGYIIYKIVILKNEICF